MSISCASVLPAVIGGIFLVGLSSDGAAQSSSLGEASAKLTGESSREWLGGDVKVWMGSITACTTGERYRFYTDKTLHRESCINGQVKVSDGTWTLAQDGPIDMVLTIDGTRYLVIFFDGKDKLQHMILRRRSESKVDPNVDREFVLSGD
ncbi:hypothetical protein [Neorhizobium sp. T6_25]|uniref:hypothetical protein n=1 Tax=Neorhizobium sp. T6_25 TaxID=2093833 RepID=UPI000CF93982|nr:hypothetical protein [Neorhizobium sp. T6_25]